MTRAITIALAVLAVAPATASAGPRRHHDRLPMRTGRTRIVRAVKEDVSYTPGATGRVGNCWRRSRRKIACDIRETGIAFGGIGGWDLDAVYSVTGAHGAVYIG